VRKTPQESRDPYDLFGRWYEDAERAGTLLPEAMALATATRKGLPSVRMVLHRGFSRSGFVFHTNYRSRKAVELLANPRAAFVFHWPLIERQVRGEGRVEKLTRQESDAYFGGRPRESQLSAWVSPQSREIPDRAFLEREYERARIGFTDKAIPRPTFWGGFRIVPDKIEFWQGLPHRLHDRLLFEKKGRGWRVVSLAP
jgi:pyridoxamine 5'-phosphate oxidase